MNHAELARQMNAEAKRLEERADHYNEVAAQLRDKAAALRRRANRLDAVPCKSSEAPR